MKSDKDIEKILLNDENYEKFINSKAEKEFTDILKKAGNNAVKIVTDIKSVPACVLFGKEAVFCVINKSSQTKSFINGMQADGFLGNQNSVRQKLINGQTDAFISGDNYIKFYKAKV